MFPVIRSNITGLDPKEEYIIGLDLVPADENRYKYHNTEWAITGKAENLIPSRVFIHPDSPGTGAQWMRQVVSFQKLKLTNNLNDQSGHVSIQNTFFPGYILYIGFCHGCIRDDEWCSKVFFYHKNKGDCLRKVSTMNSKYRGIDCLFLREESLFPAGHETGQN